MMIPLEALCIMIFTSVHKPRNAVTLNEKLTFLLMKSQPLIVDSERLLAPPAPIT